MTEVWNEKTSQFTSVLITLNSGVHKSSSGALSRSTCTVIGIEDGALIGLSGYFEALMEKLRQIRLERQPFWRLKKKPLHSMAITADIFPFPFPNQSAHCKTGQKSYISELCLDCANEFSRLI